MCACWRVPNHCSTPSPSLSLTLTHSFTHSLTHTHTHSLIHSLTHTHTHSYTYMYVNPLYCSSTGVADGVGGWRQYGIDSSLFSSALMEGCRRFVLEGGLQVPSPLSIIKAAYKELTEHKAPLFGKLKCKGQSWRGSTHCIMNQFSQI